MNKVRTNIVVDKEVWTTFTAYVPAGQRSTVLTSAIKDIIAFKKRKAAADFLDQIRITDPIHMTTEEVIRLKNYGRK